MNIKVAVDPSVCRKMPNSSAAEWKEDYLDLLMAVFPNAEFSPQSAMGGYIRNVYGLAHLNGAHTWIGGYLFVEVDLDRFVAISNYCKRFPYYRSVYTMTDTGWWNFPHKDSGEESKPRDYDHALYAACPPPKWEPEQPKFEPGHQYLLAMSGNYGIDRPKGADKSLPIYRVGYIRGIVALTMVDGIKKDWTPKRSSYSYVELNDNVIPVGSYFTVMAATEKIESIATFPATDNDTLFVLVDGQWWSFPYSSRGIMIGFTKLSEYNVKRITDAIRPAAQPQEVAKVASNGVITILKDQRGDSTPWWWVSGESTRNHIDMLKRNGGRWSKKRKAWYFIGNELHAEVLALAGGSVEESADADTATDEVLL